MMEPDLETMADSDNLRLHNGFPNPAVDHLNQSRKLALDLNRLLIRQPSSTYLFRVSGHTWEEQGIFDGDLAIIDRALMPTKLDLVLTWQVAGFVLCLYQALTGEEIIWGVVSAIIHQYHPRGINW